VIVGMDNRKVAGLDDLRRLMVGHKVGDAVPFWVVTPGQPRRTVVVTLVERPPLV
jgi:S1-C subfamily serine protease